MLWNNESLDGKMIIGGKNVCERALKGIHKFEYDESCKLAYIDWESNGWFRILLLFSYQNVMKTQHYEVTQEIEKQNFHKTMYNMS
jgi:hypothetical protein